MQAEKDEIQVVDIDGDVADEDDAEPAGPGTFPPPPPGRTERVSFATFCDLLEALQEEYRHARRVEILRDFREKNLTVKLS